MLSVSERLLIALARFCAVAVGCIPLAALAALAWGSVRWFGGASGAQLPDLLHIAGFTVAVVLCGGIAGGAAGTAAAIAAEEFVPLLLRGAIQAAIGVLAATPAVVYGWFAVNVEWPTILRYAPSMTTAAFTAVVVLLAIMSAPTACALCARALRHVPDSVRHGAAAAGASRLQTTMLVVLPALRRRIGAAWLAAIARSLAEATAVIILVAAIAHTQPTIAAWLLRTATASSAQSAATAIAFPALVLTIAVAICSWIIAREFRWLHWA
jgi:ABC-type phosphate transport system permease subunit